MASRRLRAILAPWWMAALVTVLVPAARAAAGKELAGVVNLNTAAPELLALLTGIGPSKARAIVSYRARHPFRTVDELVRVKGIGRRMVRQLRPHLAIAGPSTARPGTAATAAPPPPQQSLPPPVHAAPATPRVACGPAARGPAAPAASRPPRPAIPALPPSRANHCRLPR